MANLTGTAEAFHGDTTVVDSTQLATLGMRAWDSSGNEYVYLRGTASTVAGDWINFNDVYLTERLAANAVGPVAIAMAATVADNYGWYQVFGTNTVARTDTIAAKKSLYIDGTTGRADDLGVAGDLIIGAYSMTADTSNVATVSLNYPSVSDDLGSGGSATPGGVDTNVQYNDAGSFGGDPDFSFNENTGTVAAVGFQVGTAHIIPASSDGASLGTSSLAFSDLFLASGAVINLNAGALTLTHAAANVTVGGGDFRVTSAGTATTSVVTRTGTQTLTNKTIDLTDNTLSATSAELATAVSDETGSGALVFATSPGFTTAANPVSNDGAALGTTSLKWSDLWLASGAVVNFNSDDVTLTHSADTLTVAGGTFATATLTAAALTATGTTTLATSLTGVLRADSGVVATDSDVTDIVSAASTTLAGKVELATAAEITTGTSTSLAMVPGNFANSAYGRRQMQIKVYDDSTALSTGSNKVIVWIPSALGGYRLVNADAYVSSTSTGVLNIDVRNITIATSMLATHITIDANEFDSSTAATLPVTSGTVSTADRLAIDIQAGGTAKGLGISLQFQPA